MKTKASRGQIFRRQAGAAPACSAFAHDWGEIIKHSEKEHSLTVVTHTEHCVNCGLARVVSVCRTYGADSNATTLYYYDESNYSPETPPDPVSLPDGVLVPEEEENVESGEPVNDSEDTIMDIPLPHVEKNEPPVDDELDLLRRGLALAAEIPGDESALYKVEQAKAIIALMRETD